MALIDVVQWAGSPDIFAWRFPESNLTTLTQLIVHQTQEALLFRKGELLAQLGPGKHTLSTENIPLLENLYGIPFGGKNPFTAEVWFVNKVFSLDIKWGTPQAVQLRDPEFGVMIPVRAHGQFGMQIGDARTFITKLVGTLPLFDQARIGEYFRGLLLSRATSMIATAITREKVCVLDIASRMSQLSDALRDQLQPEFAEYGIQLVNFYVNQISIPENDPAVVQFRNALAKRAEMNILGYNYQQERSFDVLGNAASNEGIAGTMMGGGIGLGMGVGVGQSLGGMMNNVATNVQQPMRNCPSCEVAIAREAHFCHACGKPSANSATAQAQAPQCTCDKCGNTIPEGSKFCPHCGDSYNPCPKCKADITLGATSCPACGEKLPTKCTACDGTIPPQARFCPACGAAASRTAVCPQCNSEVEANASFCAKCGSKIAK